MSVWTPPQTDTERLAWVRLIRSENVGPATFFQLMGRYRSPMAALEALPDLAARGGLKRKIKLASPSAAEKELSTILAGGGEMIFHGEERFPYLLAATEQGPPLLTVLGNVELLNRPALAMVGARNASAAGRKFARELAHALGKRDFIIVSGLARGMDTAAHEGALETGTIAVMAGGVDHIYPPQNEGLYGEIMEKGTLVSEMPWGLKPQARNFPRRNRIVSGLSRGVVVVEAAARSGSLITARYGAEQNREVFAVPGSPLDPRCEGSNRLIQDGARLVLTADDVVDTLAQFQPDMAPAQQAFAEFEEHEDIADHLRNDVMELLGGTPVHLDDLVRELSLPAGLVSAVLLELELAGKVDRLSGSTFILRF